MAAKYWIAQHVSDLFRNEPMNVGVFVEHAGVFRAKFLGEGDDGQIDGRRIRSRFLYPDVYKQWVEYWKTQAEKGDVSSILNSGKAHFRVTPGGEVSDVGTSTAADVTSYIYSMLVSDGGLREALGGDAEEQTTSGFLDELLDAFNAQNILAGGEVEVRHPIVRERQVLGRQARAYRPAFVQENGALYVMETVDFTSSKKKPARDHAGWAAYMFNDVKIARGNDVVPIAIVRVTDRDRDTEEVRNGIALLQGEANFVDWLNPNDQQSFLEQRRRIAVGAN